jgi:O-antigen ligase
LTSLSTDQSYIDRQRIFGNALTTALQQPTGEGLGVLGVAAKLTAVGGTVDFDNGYIARLTEMGYFGFAAYLAALLVMLVYAWRRWRTYDRLDDRGDAAIAAAVVGIQAGLAFLDISGDHHNQFSGIVCWLSFALLFVGDAARTDPVAHAKR